MSTTPTQIERLSHDPADPTQGVMEVIHGVLVADPFRWLEDQNSTMTRDWLAAQKDALSSYLQSIPDRADIRARITELLDCESLSSPVSAGGRCFYLRRQKTDPQASIVMRSQDTDFETVLVDPAMRGTGEHTAVSIFSISQDGKWLAYLLRHGGTDTGSIEILNVDSKEVLADRLPQGLCGGLVIPSNGEGFYYTHCPPEEIKTTSSVVRWHTFGTDLTDDREVFRMSPDPNNFIAVVSNESASCLAYLVCSLGTQRSSSLFLHDLGSRSAPRLLFQDFVGIFNPFFIGNRLFAYAEIGAQNRTIVEVNVEDSSQWKSLFDSAGPMIQQFAVVGDDIVVTRVWRFSTQLESLNVTTGEHRIIYTASPGSIDLSPQLRSEDLFFTVTSISTPPTTYRYSRTGGSGVFASTPVAFDPDLVSFNEVSYVGKDGQSIPMLIAARKDLLNKGPRPTFLTAYGGFGACVTPRFTAFATFLIEHGLLFAVPAIRGGGELGPAWHKAGRGINRQKAFDDFLAAADWLVREKFAVPDQIAIGGGSNAGLLVGAAVTQRPQLFRAAICVGPLLDMLRYHLFDLAAGWAQEYGSAEEKEQFEWLYSYSPYHRVIDGAPYPAVLFVSGDSDTRCNPMHARKMAARLHRATSSGRPVLLDYRTVWGHTPVQPIETKIDALTDRIAFILDELGLLCEQRRNLTPSCRFTANGELPHL